MIQTIKSEKCVNTKYIALTINTKITHTTKEKK
jgi:hypothetical protein